MDFGQALKLAQDVRAWMTSVITEFEMIRRALEQIEKLVKIYQDNKGQCETQILDELRIQFSAYYEQIFKSKPQPGMKLDDMIDAVMNAYKKKFAEMDKFFLNIQYVTLFANFAGLVVIFSDNHAMLTNADEFKKKLEVLKTRINALAQLDLDAFQQETKAIEKELTVVAHELISTIERARYNKKLGFLFFATTGVLAMMNPSTAVFTIGKYVIPLKAGVAVSSAVGITATYFLYNFTIEKYEKLLRECESLQREIIDAKVPLPDHYVDTKNDFLAFLSIAKELAKNSTTEI